MGGGGEGGTKTTLSGKTKLEQLKGMEKNILVQQDGIQVVL